MRSGDVGRAYPRRPLTIYALADVASVPLFSSPESVRRGKLSVLAIAESVAATTVSLWLAWEHGSVQHIVLASALAPFLLLRTRLSTRYTLFTIDVMNNKYEKYGDVSGVIMILLLLPIKFYASFKVFLRRPVHSMAAIPGNFYKSVFVVDLGVPPHPIPAMLDEQVNRIKYYYLDDLDIYRICKEFVKLNEIEKQSIRNNLFRGLIFNVFLTKFLALALFLPIIAASISFRWSIKSTSILWLPLIWLIFQADPGKKISDRIAITIKSSWFKVMLLYSVAVFFLFIGKLALVFSVWKLRNLEWLGPLGTLTMRLVSPFDLPLWQVAGAINASLVLIFFVRAERHLLAQNSAEAWPDAWIQREYAIIQTVRTTLSLYIVACTFYIAATTAWQTELPPLRFILFPWTA